MAHLIEWYRRIMLDGTHPQAAGILALSAVAIATALVGAAVFSTVRQSIPEQL